MKIEIVGTPSEKILDILKTHGTPGAIDFRAGKIDITFGEEMTIDAVRSVKQGIIYTLAGEVQSYIMKVVA